MTIHGVRLPMLLLVEGLWGWALAAVVAYALSGGDGDGPSFVAVAAIVLGAAGFGALLRQFDVGEAQTRAFGVLSMLIAVAAVIALDYRDALVVTEQRAAIVGAAIALAGIWIRGATRHDPDELFEPIAKSALLGVVPVAIAAAMRPDVNGGGSFGAVAILYVPLALLVLALHMAAEPQKRVETMATGWAPFALAAVVAGAAIALFVVAINPAGSGVLSPLGDALAPVGDALGRYIFGPFFAALAWLFSWLPSFQQEQQVQPQPPPERPPPKEDEDPSAWGEWLAWAARVIVPLIIIGAVLFAIWMLFQLTRRKGERPEDDVLDREGDGDDGGPGLLASLRNPFRRNRDPSSAIAIRRLYGEVLERAAADGLERAPSVTPLQFEPALDSRYAGVGTEITRAFMESRYGGREVGDDRVQDLRARWEAGLNAQP